MDLPCSMPSLARRLGLGIFRFCRYAIFMFVFRAAMRAKRAHTGAFKAPPNHHMLPNCGQDAAWSGEAALSTPGRQSCIRLRGHAQNPGVHTRCKQFPAYAQPHVPSLRPKNDPPLAWPHGIATRTSAAQAPSGRAQVLASRTMLAERNAFRAEKPWYPLELVRQHCNSGATSLCHPTK